MTEAQGDQLIAIATDLLIEAQAQALRDQAVIDSLDALASQLHTLEVLVHVAGFGIAFLGAGVGFLIFLKTRHLRNVV